MHCQEGFPARENIRDGKQRPRAGVERGTWMAPQGRGLLCMRPGGTRVCAKDLMRWRRHSRPEFGGGVPENGLRLRCREGIRGDLPPGP
jgi:hypothetical protein